jgi:predicted amidohydrolase YtcJ
MKLRNIFVLLAVCVFFASCGKKPDVIYVNGKIYTLDKNNTIAEAIAVGEGQIIAVGKSSELKEKYSSVKVIDLQGKTVVPGFIDAEGNLMEFSRNLGFVDLRNARNLDDIIKMVTEKVKTAKEGEWVGGFGWDELVIPENDFKKLDYKILDAISTKHKIYLINSRADITWVNSAVLLAAGINKNIPDPQNGEIEKDDKGEPTGFVYDDAQEMIIKVLPQPSEQQVMENVQNGIKELFKYGITEINDANINENALGVYKKMVDDNRFPIRMYAMINGKGPMFEKYLASGPENYKDRINIKCFHLEYDGYFETQDAAMENDYKDEPKRKTPYNDEFDIKDMSKKAFEKGFQVSIKAIGDRGVNATLNAIESVSKEVKSKSGRTRIEYIEFIAPNDIPRIKQLEIIPSLRPEVTLTDKAELGDLINPDNAKNLGLWSTLLKQSGMVISGTDFPYHTISPLIQMYYLSTGMSLDTAENRISNNAGQKLSLIDALKSFTTWAAYASFDDDVKGSLEPGKIADMVVLSNDILSSDPSVLLKTKILMTIIRGDVLYENKTPAAELNR